MTTTPIAVRMPAAAPVLVLVAVAVTWGISFSVVDSESLVTAPTDLVAWRFGLATAVLMMLRRAKVPMPVDLRRRGIVLGGVLGLGFLLQSWALTETDAVMSGFLVGTLVVIAPMLGWALFRVRPPRATWLGVAVATAGLAVLGLRAGAPGRGELLTLLAAAAWALHLVLLARWGRPGHALGLARIQTGTVTAVALATVAIGGAVDGGFSSAGSLLPALPANGGSWLSLGFLALPATAGAMVAVSWAQPRMTAARAAVILTLEPAAAAATGAILGSELGPRTLVGGCLLIGAMLVVELGSRPTASPPGNGAESSGGYSWRRTRTDRRLIERRPDYCAVNGDS